MPAARPPTRARGHPSARRVEEERRTGATRRRANRRLRVPGSSRAGSDRRPLRRSRRAAAREPARLVVVRRWTVGRCLPSRRSHAVLRRGGAAASRPEARVRRAASSRGARSGAERAFLVERGAATAVRPLPIAPRSRSGTTASRRPAATALAPGAPERGGPSASTCATPRAPCGRSIRAGAALGRRGPVRPALQRRPPWCSTVGSPRAPDPELEESSRLRGIRRARALVAPGLGGRPSGAAPAAEATSSSVGRRRSTALPPVDSAVARRHPPGADRRRIRERARRRRAGASTPASPRAAGPFVAINCAAVPGSAPRERAVRQRRAAPTPAPTATGRGSVRGRGRRHALPRRDRRHAARRCRPSCCASLQEGRVRAVGERRGAADRRPRHRGDPPRPPAALVASGRSAPTCATGWRSSWCACRRCASAWRTSPSS